MATKKKMLQAAAGQAGGGAALDITDVFSTYLYEGNNSTQTITNGIDLAGEGGMVWIKDRSLTRNHHVVDTERGIGDGIRALRTNLTDAEYYEAGYDAYEVTSANSDGFSLGLNLTNETNRSTDNYASWTFRKAPKFFDVVTYSGNGGTQNISHNLGSVPGMIIVKCTSLATSWHVLHRSLGPDNGIQLNSTGAADPGDTTYWNSTTPSTSSFTVSGTAQINGSGQTYVAYLFAHNDGDGGFGPDGDQDIIKCGSYTGNSSGVEIDLGFEPQWFMCKKTNGGADWQIFDTMRGMHFNTTTQSVRLSPNTSGAETSQLIIGPSPTGVSIPDASDSVNISGGEYIYMAIRRGPLAQPESATEVFAAHKETTSTLNQTPPFLQPAPFAVDFISNKMFGGTSAWWSATRLTDARMQFNQTNAETSVSTTHEFDHNDGVAVNGLSGSTNFMGYMWKRAPGFFDVVAYTGNGTNPHNISHNLGVAPEMMWVKQRDSTGNWEVYYDTGNPSTNNGLGLLRLNSTGTDLNGTFVWGNTHPTDSVFTVGSNGTNRSGGDFIAYLFATLPGVSKVGSYTADGNAQNIDCGFTSGARFVLIKRTDTGGNWFVLDTARGIVSGNDPLLELNSTGAEDNQYDNLDPYSAGFTVAAYGGTSPYLNISGGTYIFYAIA